MAHRKSPAVGLLRLTTTVEASGVWMLAMSKSDDRSGLVLVWFRLAATSADVTGWPFENASPGRIWKVTVEPLLEIVQLWATPPPTAVFPGVVIDWYMFEVTVYEQSFCSVAGAKSLLNSLLRS